MAGQHTIRSCRIVLYAVVQLRQPGCGLVASLSPLARLSLVSTIESTDEEVQLRAVIPSRVLVKCIWQLRTRRTWCFVAAPTYQGPQSPKSARMPVSQCQCDISQPRVLIRSTVGLVEAEGRKRRCRQHTSRGLSLRYRCIAVKSEAGIDAAKG